MKAAMFIKMKNAARPINTSLTVLFAVYVASTILLCILTVVNVDNTFICLILLAIAVMHFVFNVLIFKNVKSIIKTIEDCDTPFVSHNVKCIKKTAVLTIVTSILPSYKLNFTTGVFTIDFLSFNFVPLMAGLCLLFLSFVFAYVCALQEKDEE